MEKQAICVDKLVYRYQGQDENEQHVVFNGLDLSIAEGSFVAVLGHNGCGKSTLAKHMNAILLPQGGSVTVYGMDTRDEALLLEIRRSVGMVFQNPDNQIVSNVVEEDVAFAPENLGVPPEEIRRRVDEALKLVGMYEYRDHAPHLLSGGQKQRIAIAGVIAMRPRCIVLDEPTSYLDIRYKLELLTILKRMVREEHLAVLMSLHELDLAARVSDTVVCVAGDRIDRVGPPSEIFTPDYIAALYRMEPGKYDPCFDSLEFAPGGAR